MADDKMNQFEKEIDAMPYATLMLTNQPNTHDPAKGDDPPRLEMVCRA